MPKSQSPQPQPEVQTPAAPAKTADRKVVGIRGGQTASEIRAHGRKDVVGRKHSEEQRIRQALAEIADLYAAGAEKAQEAETAAVNLQTEMFIDVRDGIFPINVVSSMLGDTFGYRKKGDAKTRVPAGHKDAGRTPFGAGEAIRKRIVRAFQAFDYVSNGNATALFEGLPKDDVAEVVNRIGADENGITVWTAYDTLGKLKTRETNRAPAFFDPRKVAALTDGLTANLERSAELFAENAALGDAWAELVEVIHEIDVQAGAILTAKAA